MTLTPLCYIPHTTSLCQLTISTMKAATSRTRMASSTFATGSTPLTTSLVVPFWYFALVKTRVTTDYHISKKVHA